jgi:hypothetical protein
MEYFVYLLDVGMKHVGIEEEEEEEEEEGNHLRKSRMDLPGPTTLVGTRTDYPVGPWDYSACATRHLMARGTRTMVEKYSNRKLYMSCPI